MAISAKKYLSESWLRRQVLVLKKKPEDVAEECGVNKRTIYRQLEKFNIIKKR